jgi:hypothetical protein
MKIFAAIFLFFISLVATESDTEKIEWSETQKLTWADFKGVPNKGAGYVASTSSGIAFAYSYRTFENKVEYNYSVECHFYPLESWYKSASASGYILKHEQAHFDISEIHARILRKRISEAKFSINIKTEIESIYELAERQRREMQKLFDAETEHSKNKDEELRWEAFIQKQLKAYDPWR